MKECEAAVASQRRGDVHGGRPLAPHRAGAVGAPPFGARRRQASRKSGGAILAASSFRVIHGDRFGRMVHATLAGVGIRDYSRRQRQGVSPGRFPAVRSRPPAGDVTAVLDASL
jgi:hypothetical protein